MYFLRLFCHGELFYCISLVGLVPGNFLLYFLKLFGPEEFFVICSWLVSNYYNIPLFLPLFLLDFPCLCAYNNTEERKTKKKATINEKDNNQ